MRRVLIGLLTAVLVACGSTPQGSTPSSSVAPAAKPSASGPAISAFLPPFTYTVPDGWAVTHDLDVLFRLLPTPFTNQEFDAGQTDGITVIRHVTVSKLGCDETDPSIGDDVDSIAAALLSRRGLIATEQKASVAGVPGVVLDIRLDPKWTQPGCGGGAPGVALIHGPTYDQGISGKTLIRLYLAPLPGSTSNISVGIEADDLTGGSHIENLSKIVSGIKFLQ